MIVLRTLYLAPRQNVIRFAEVKPFKYTQQICAMAELQKIRLEWEGGRAGGAAPLF